MDEIKLTPKQEKFCLVYIETGNASEAYRQSYNTAKMKPETVNRTAKQLLDNRKIAARLDELREEHAKRHEITVDTLVAELEEARKLAFETDKAAAAVQATMGKAKLLGLDKQIVDITSNGESINGKPFDLSGLTNEQLQFLDTIATQASESGAGT